MFIESKNHYLQKTGFKELKPKAVLFDMDGVLFDSMPNHAKSWVKVCEDFGLKMETHEAYLHEGRTGEATINILTRKSWGRNATAEEVAKIYEEKCLQFNQCPEAPKMPGVEDLLAQIKAQGLKIFVVTGSGQLSLLQRLETHFPGYFKPETIVSSKDVKQGKPHPEPYLLGLQKAKVQPWEAIVIENAPLGVEAAIAAKIYTIAVNSGPLHPETLLEAGADALFPSMRSLADSWRTFWESISLNEP